MSYPFQTLCGGYTKNCTLPVITPPTGKQLNVYSFRATNQSGGTCDLAVGATQANGALKFYQITAASTPNATDFTSAIQGGGAVNIFDTTINDGYMVGCSTQFNVIGLNISNGQTGAPVYLYQYWNGSAWTTLTVLSSPATYALGTQLVVFAAPEDWVAGTNVATGGAAGYFYIKVTATTAPTDIVQANNNWEVSFLMYAPQVANFGNVEFRVFNSEQALVLNGTSGLIPYFGTANAKNTVDVIYSVQ